MSGTQAAPLGVPLAGSAAERLLQRALTAVLALLGFFILFSTAGTAFALTLLLLLAIPFAPRIARQPWRREPVLGLGLALLGYIALRTAAEGLARAQLGEINRYHELLMIPLVWAMLRVARRPRALLLGLLAGALWFALLHWLAPLDARIAAFIASRRISAGFGLSLCAFLLFEHARLGALPRAPSCALAGLLVLTVLFATEGRTGHLTLLLLLACAAWRAAPRRWRWPALAGVLAGVLLLGALSPSVRGRVAETVQGLAAPRPASAPPDATSIRLQLLPNAIEVAREHWLLGTGWAGYAAAYRAVAAARPSTQPVPPDAPWLHTDNPHNEYLMQLGAGGLPALLLFTAWLVLPLARARRAAAADPWAGTLACAALAFALGCVFNSLLLDFVEGHVYAATLAWLLARRERG